MAPWWFISSWNGSLSTAERCYMMCKLIHSFSDLSNYFQTLFTPSTSSLCSADLKIQICLWGVVKCIFFGQDIGNMWWRNSGPPLVSKVHKYKYILYRLITLLWSIWGELWIMYIWHHCMPPSQHYKTDLSNSVHIMHGRRSETRQRRKRCKKP